MKNYFESIIKSTKGKFFTAEFVKANGDYRVMTFSGLKVSTL